MHSEDQECVTKYVNTMKEDKVRIDVRGNGMSVRLYKLKSALRLFKIPEANMTRDFLEDIATIAQGKVWSEEYDNDSKKLANRINEEFDNLMAQGN
jgi:hypothetical protein